MGFHVRDLFAVDWVEVGLHGRAWRAHCLGFGHVGEVYAGYADYGLSVCWVLVGGSTGKGKG